MGKPGSWWSSPKLTLCTICPAFSGEPLGSWTHRSVKPCVWTNLGSVVSQLRGRSFVVMEGILQNAYQYISQWTCLPLHMVANSWSNTTVLFLANSFELNIGSLQCLYNQALCICLYAVDSLQCLEVEVKENIYESDELVNDCGVIMIMEVMAAIFS